MEETAGAELRARLTGSGVQITPFRPDPRFNEGVTQLGASGLPAQLLGLHAAGGDPLGNPLSPPPPLLAFLIAGGLVSAVALTAFALAVTTSMLVLAVTAIVHATVLGARLVALVIRVVAVVSSVAALAVTVLAIGAVVVPLGLCLAASISLGVRLSDDWRQRSNEIDARSARPTRAPVSRPVHAPVPTAGPGVVEVAAVADAA